MEKTVIEAAELFSAGRCADAIALLTPFINLNPTNGDAFYWRAANRYALWEDADNTIFEASPILDDLASAIALDPKHIDARFLRAQALAQSELPNYQAMLEDVEVILAQTPTFDESMRAIGFALLAHEQSGQTSQVLACFDRWIAIIKQSPVDTASLHPRTKIDERMTQALSEKAAFLQRSKQSELALACYVSALEHKPDSPQILSEAGLLAFSLEQYDLAADYFIGATVWESQTLSAVHAELLEKAIKEGKIESPALYVAYALLHMDTAYLRGDLSNTSDKTLFEKSIALADKALALDATFNAANVVLARAWGNLGDAAKSVHFFEKYFVLAKDDVFNQARYLCVRINANLPFPNNFPIMLDTEIAYDFYNAGVVINEQLDERDHKDEGDDDFAKPYRAFAKTAYLRACALFQAYLDRGEGSAVNNQQHIAGMAHHNCANRIKPDYALALTLEETSIRYSAFYENMAGRARLLHELDRHDEAGTAYANVFGNFAEFQCEDDVAFFHFGFWGASLRKAKRYAEAIPVLEKVLIDFAALPAAAQHSLQSEHRQYSDMTTDLAEAYSATGDWQAMRATFNKALQRFPKDAALWNNFGWNYHCFGKFEEAEEAYSAGILACLANVNDSAVLDLYTNRGDLYFHHLNKVNQAATDYKKVFELEQHFSTAMRLVKLNMQTKNWREARKWTEEADYYDYKHKIGDNEKLAELNALSAQIACEFGTRAQFVKSVRFAQKAIALDANQNTEAMQALLKMAEHKVATMRKKFLGIF